MAEQSERKCIVSGDVKPKADMLRFVIGPEHQVVFDVKGKLPGRGLWLSPELDMVKTALAKNSFAKAAKAQAILPDNLTDEIVRQLRAACLARVGLARGAGQLTQGYEKVLGAVKKMQAGSNVAGVLLEANDGSDGGREKIMRAATGLPVVTHFTAAEIGQAIGRDNAVHALMKAGKMADAFLRDVCKLAGVTDQPLPSGENSKLSECSRAE